MSGLWCRQGRLLHSVIYKVQRVGEKESQRTHNPQFLVRVQDPQPKGDIMSVIKSNTKRVPNVPEIKNKGAVKPVQAKPALKVKPNIMRKAGRGR